MEISKNNVMEYVKEDDVKFIRLAFVDIDGELKNISIMPDELERVFNEGFIIDSGDIFRSTSKIKLVPDSNTLSVLPWRPSQGRVVRMFCNILNKDGTPFVYDSRKYLIDALKNNEHDIKIQTKYDFYLFKADEEGNNTFIPYDNAKYMSVAPLDKGENVRREICLSLVEMGINPVASHHAAGPGQNRIFFGEENPLASADDAITFISVVKTIAARNGLFADFEIEPIMEGIKNKSLIEITVDNPDEAYKNIVNNYTIIKKFTKNASKHMSNVVLEDGKIIINASSFMNPYLVFGAIVNAINNKLDDSYKVFLK